MLTTASALSSGIGMRSATSWSTSGSIPCCFAASTKYLPTVRIGLDADPANAARIIWEIRSSTGPNLHDAAGEVGEQPLLAFSNGSFVLAGQVRK